MKMVLQTFQNYNPSLIAEKTSDKIPLLQIISQKYLVLYSSKLSRHRAKEVWKNLSQENFLDDNFKRWKKI